MSAKLSSVVANKQFKDVLVSQKKELSAGAQRISSILKNCISQVEIVADLSAVLQLNIMPNDVNKELREAIQQHQILVERLETLEGLKQESDGQLKDGGEVKKRALAQTEKDIKNSVRDLLRFFQAHPDAIFGLRAAQGIEVAESDGKLVNGLKMFHHHTEEKLLTSPDEELQQVTYKYESSSHYLDLLAAEVEQNATAINKLNAKVRHQLV